MGTKIFIITSSLILTFFTGCNQIASSGNEQDSNTNCTITINQFYQLTGAEDSVVKKILPHCFKIDRRGDFREFTYYIAIYDSSNSEYYDQFSVTTDHNNRSVYYTTSNQKNYENYKTGLMNSGFTNDTIEYGEQVFLKDEFKLLLRESEPNGQKRYTIYLSKTNNTQHPAENDETSWLPNAEQILSIIGKNKEYVDKILSHTLQSRIANI